MNLHELLQRIDDLQARILAAGPLSPEAKRKLDYRFRLDWNYHSNVMEGSQLTRQETRTIMMGNVTVEGKPIRDVLEMQGHDEVVRTLLGMASGELNLSEKRIKEIHKAIMHEDDPAKKDWPGNWKKHPNHIYNFKEERFDFTSPEDVPEAMHRLLDRTKAALESIRWGEKEAPHPTVVAFDFQREYVTIHPFHDGNGRTARIFSNLLLLSFGYPPTIIKAEEQEKTAYNRLLAEVQVYGASPDLFNAFMAERLIRSQELVLEVLAGKDIDDADDLDKRLQLIDAQLAAVDPADEIQRTRGHQTTQALLNEWGYSLFAQAIPVAQKFNRYFLNTQHDIILVNGPVSVRFLDEPAEQVIGTLQAELAKDDQKLQGVTEIQLWLRYGTFRKASKKPFGCNYGIKIKVEDYHHYQVLVDVFNITGGRSEEPLIKRLYHKPLSLAEQQAIVQRMGKEITDHIEYYVAQNAQEDDTK
ncbi:MAG: Fic family protein [Flavobacteriales bacterium]|nr:Fic family protein [Flavobacteriales bacterium]